MIDAVIRALGMALAMGWEILWPLILGFILSAVVQAERAHLGRGRFLCERRRDCHVGQSRLRPLTP